MKSERLSFKTTDLCDGNAGKVSIAVPSELKDYGGEIILEKNSYSKML